MVHIGNYFKNNMTEMSAIIFMTCEVIFRRQQVLHVWCNIKRFQNGESHLY